MVDRVGGNSIYDRAKGSKSLFFSHTLLLAVVFLYGVKEAGWFCDALGVQNHGRERRSVILCMLQ